MKNFLKNLFDNDSNDSAKIYQLIGTEVKHSTFAEQFKKYDLENALERAWKNRDFEIEMYWKRAAYFWTFIGAAFAGFFVLIGSTGYQDNLKSDFYHIEVFIIFIGLIFSMAWYYVNLGSKRWQENWEKQIDELEGLIGRPNYSTIYYSSKHKYYSVSKINQKVSKYVGYIWGILFLSYIVRYGDHYWGFHCQDIDWEITFLNVITLIFPVIIYCFWKFLRNEAITGALQKGMEIAASKESTEKDFFFGRIRK